MRDSTNRDVALRAARLSDVGRLCTLARQTFRATYDHLPDECVEPHLAEAATRAAFESSIRAAGNDVGVVERSDGDLVGFSHAIPASHAATSARRSVMLSQLYLLPEHHGTGTGSALLHRVESWATGRGHDELWLTVWAWNARAIGFYTSRGFRTVGATAVRVGRCRDLDLVMSKPLVPPMGTPEPRSVSAR